MTRIRWYGPAVLLLLTVLLVMISGPRLVKNIVYARERATIELVGMSLEQSELLAEMNEAFRQVAERVQPSVVSIQTYDRRRPVRPFSTRRPFHPFFDPRSFDEEEQRNHDDNDFKRYDRPRPVGSGSGWVYDENGHIITNHHVITLDDRRTIVDEIKVQFRNGDSRVATVVGTDPDTDVAVLRIEGGNPHPAVIATDTTQQGEMVFAFGAPLGFDFSMSQGIVSAKNRQLGIIRRHTRFGRIDGYENFIQTDAAINRGNSGGPLTNIMGQVVGMNSAIAIRDRMSEGFIGIGFAIPIDMVREVTEQIISAGRVARGWLGIEYTPLEEKQARTFGYEEGKALLVERVLEEGPAEKAGLKRSDIIVKLEDEKVVESYGFRSKVAGIKPGTSVDIEVFRDGATLVIPVVLAEKPTGYSLGGKQQPHETEGGTDLPDVLLHKLGIEKVRTLTPEIAEHLNTNQATGVLVRRVRHGSIAASEGLAAGQIITRVMDNPVKNRSTLIEQLDEHKDQDVIRITVVKRDGSQRFIYLEMPKD